MQKDIDSGLSVMVLASCSYMLDPTIKELRKNGVVFHNPYRTKAGAWNPLKPPAKGKVSSAEQVASFVEQIPLGFFPDWGEAMMDIKSFCHGLQRLKQNGNLDRGAKQAVQQMLVELLQRDRGTLVWVDEKFFC